jgi:hypothetical protein
MQRTRLTREGSPFSPTLSLCYGITTGITLRSPHRIRSGSYRTKETRRDRSTFDFCLNYTIFKLSSL